MIDYVGVKRYIVTLHDFEMMESLHNDLETDGIAPPGTDILRAVICVNKRPVSRNSEFMLTAWEVEELKKDTRVKNIELIPSELGISAGEFSISQTSTNWNKSGSSATDMNNWGLLRCVEGSQRANWGGLGFDGTGTGNPIASGTIKLAQTGKNVDVVIIDGNGITFNHPEYAVNSNGTGGSRAVQYNWLQHDPVVRGLPPGNYVYSTSDHATHVAGTVAGNTQGWARAANIYNIYYYAGDEGNALFPYVMDYVREFHRTKTVNPATGRKNPTICNNSWGMSIFPGEWSFADITAVTYRGTRYEAPGGTTNYTGLSGVYSSNSLLSFFTNDPENISQRIITTGSQAGTPNTVTFNSIPGTWVQEGAQCYFNSFVQPNTTYQLTFSITQPVSFEILSNVAVGSTTGPIILTSEVTITDPNSVVTTYTDTIFGSQIETLIEETVSLTVTGQYTVTYTTTVDLQSSTDPVFASLMSLISKSTGGNASATVESLIGASIGTTSGLTSSTTPSSGSNDDGFWQINLPFNVTYLSVDYTAVYVGTNTYLTFGSGSANYSGLSASNPPLPKIMISSADNSVQRIYHGVEGIAPNRTYRVIVEGNANTSGTLGSPNMRYQYTFYEAYPARIDISIAQNNRKTIVGGGFSSNQLNQWGFIANQRIPVRVGPLDADLEDAIDEGILFVGAAGNGRWKHDIPGGPDWDNTFEMAIRYPGSVAQPYYYMRGTSPTANDDTVNGDYDIPNICVGAVDSIQLDQKVTFSDCGPGVDIFAPGTHILSAVPSGGAPDPRNSSFRINKNSGTSMASPQVCGVLACALETYPTMRQEQAKQYILGYSKTGQLTTTNGGPTDGRDLQGAPNKYLYYYVERRFEGNVFPKINVSSRPSSGAVFPRTRIRRS
jgi:hypothetical protein